MSRIARRHVLALTLSVLALIALGLSFGGCGGATEALTYSISGTVTSGGQALAGVTVTVTAANALTRATSGSATTGTNGTFTVSNLDAGEYTVTPSLTGYTFAPTSSTVTITASNVTGANFTGTQTSTGGTGTVTGTVYGPDGTTPVVNAYVYVPVSGTMAEALPDDAGSVWTQTDAQGTFTLAGVPAGSTTLKIAKGAWTKTFIVTVVADQSTSAPSTDTTLPTTGEGAAKMAVVTGSFDRMEDVLAKLGFGDVDSTTGQLVSGTETFDLYDAGTAAGTSTDLLTNPATMAQYSTIFLNCGCSESLLYGEQKDAVIANIQAYVQNGGCLYATDWAYDFVEQAFPSAIDFVGSPGTAAGEAETMNEAAVGDSGITCEATVVDTTLRDWLRDRGALNADDTVHIAGFLSGWVVMDGIDTGVTEWVRGPVSYYDPSAGSTSATKTLTVSFTSGDGKVVYSSYHTEEDEPGPTLKPQEWILSYLVFEAL